MVLISEYSFHHSTRKASLLCGLGVRGHLQDRDRISNSVQSFLFLIVDFFFYSSLFSLGIIVCICNVCKHNICLWVSCCVHCPMEQWSIWDAAAFLRTLLLVHNSSCSECCSSRAPSLLILKITLVTCFSSCALQEQKRKVEWRDGEFSQGFLLGIFWQLFLGSESRK